MKKAFYMKTRKPVLEDRDRMNVDKIGGLPTHKPPYFPKYPSGDEKGFIMQIYCDKDKFAGFNDILCWQIYANDQEHGDYEIVEVSVGAEINKNNEGTAIDRLEERIIYYEEGEEPDILNYEDDDIDDYLTSRIGGSIPEDYLDYEKEFIGWIFEGICDYELNFGELTMALVKNQNGNMEIMFD